jgi:hypothetical protein
MKIPLACSLALLALPLFAVVPDEDQLLENPDMSIGVTQPVGWEERWVGEGRVAVTLDKKISHSAPAALRLASQGGTAKAQVYQSVRIFPGDRIQASGWIKTAAAAPGFAAQIAVQFTDAARSPIGFHQLRYVAGDGDWQEGSGVFVAPEHTSQVALLLLIEGDGQAWLDDASLSFAKPEAPAPVASGDPSQTTGKADSTGAKLICDFSQRGFDYGYEAWKDLGKIQSATPLGRRLTGPSSGGAGLSLQPALVIAGEDTAALRIVVHEGHTAPKLSLKLLGTGGLEAYLDVATSSAQRDITEIFLLPIPLEFQGTSVGQIQLQGDFSPNGEVDVDLISLMFIKSN